MAQRKITIYPDGDLTEALADYQRAATEIAFGDLPTTFVPPLSRCITALLASHPSIEPRLAKVVGDRLKRERDNA